MKFIAADGKRRLTDVARRGGNVAAVARQALEEQTGQSVITSQNVRQLNHVVEEMLGTSASVSEE